MNENCLEGMKCPDCGNPDYFRISVLVTAEVTDEGAELALEVAEGWIHDHLDGTGLLDSALEELNPVRDAIKKAKEPKK